MRLWRRRDESGEPGREDVAVDRERACEARIAELEGDLACCSPDDMAAADRIEREMERVRAGLE
ncbi:MAG TPA: hypothetical protein VIL64_03360 [Solirubrobacteraceae bacterium]|jgi:hypothetical protein